MKTALLICAVVCFGLRALKVELLPVDLGYAGMAFFVASFVA